MNKEQAERILNGYLLIWTNPNMADAANALREIILDAMTSYKTSGYFSTSPHTITVPTNTGGWSTEKTIVSCTGGEQ